METSIAENVNLNESISETIETSQVSESYQSSSPKKENVQENQAVICDYTEENVTDNEKSSENLLHYQDSVMNSYNLDEAKDNMEADVQNSDDKSSVEAISVINNLEENNKYVNISEVAINNGSVATGNLSQVGSEDISTEYVQVKEQINENPEQVLQVGKEAQFREYGSEYMLEHHPEHVYMPEQAHEESSSISVEQTYSTEIISDDSHDNNTTYEKVVQIEHSSTVIKEVIEKSDGNFVSEYQVEQENTDSDLHAANFVSDYQREQGYEENVRTPLQQIPEKSIDQTSANENVQEIIDETFKIDYTNSNVEIENANDMETCDNNTSEVDNQDLNENTSNQISTSDTLIMEESITNEGVNKDGTADEYIGSVKEEVHFMKGEKNLVLANKQGIEPENQPIEHVIESTEIEQNNEIANVSDPLSDNVQNYTIDESIEVTVREGEYTIVEGPDSVEITTNQHDEETNSDQGLVLIENYENSEDSSLLTDEQDETYMLEVRSQPESQSTSNQSRDNKPRRGRKPTYDIPMHVLGHDISKPVDTVPNGRPLPKPRLGVKVPYRNLTSQIVSKQEIEKEIMERARLKQEQASSRGDLIFARKLTQRLARKIAPSPERPKRAAATMKSKSAALPKNSESSKEIESSITEITETETETDINLSQNNTIIQNDSDLLAILEGEGEEMPVLPKEVPQPQIDDSNLKMLEREIALQQLQELPHQIPTQRIFRRRQGKSETKAPVLVAEASTLSKIKASATKDTPTTQPLQPLPTNDNAVKQPSSKEGSSISPRKEESSIDVSSPKKLPVEIEPQVKVNMVLKTYSRKRKTVELPESLAESPVKKAMLDENEIKVEKPEPSTTDVYVTKSSRVIKKKVIWDPDEIPSRSPKPVSKQPEIPTPKVMVKSVKSVDKNSITEKVVDKKQSEKFIKEKSLEKKTTEKVSPKKGVDEKPASPSEQKLPAPKSGTPKPGKTPIKGKKLRSEVDKLLMDEGAVKMLYDLKNTDETVAKRKKDVYSVDKAQKDLIKKANQIKNDLEQNTTNESTKSLRKKEALTPSPIKPMQIAVPGERKMSKDSTRSSVHTPPGSPAYSFPHSQSSMLIRRRSSSSMSSSDEVDTNDESRISKKKSASASSDPPKPKRVKKNEEIKEAVQPEITSKVATPKPVKPTTVENKLNQYKSFTVKKTNRHTAIDLNYINENCHCTVQVLEELTAALKKVSKDKDCNVVSITSSSKAFCLGLDYVSLVSENDEVRKSNATELAEKVRDFLLCLLNFPKVLVAGIQGDCIGLGVTMLPLFDIVIASDRATFSTPYASLGCTAEAGFLLCSPNLTNHGLAAELLFTAQKLTADDAFRRGLISRLCWPEKYSETLKNLLSSISKGSKQSLEATKKQLRRHLVQTTEAAIKSETKILIEQWVSPECQKNFAKGNGDDK